MEMHQAVFNLLFDLEIAERSSVGASCYVHLHVPFIAIKVRRTSSLKQEQLLEERFFKPCVELFG